MCTARPVIYALSSDAARAQGQRVGMVGTSGGMHAGHMSLIERAAAENDVTSLFWGGDPGSFRSPSSSTISYRRDANHDFPLAEKAGAHMIFAPLREELFPRASLTKVTLPSMSSAVPHLEDPAHLDLIALGDVQVVEHVWAVPCVLRGKGLAATGDVHAARR